MKLIVIYFVILCAVSTDCNECETESGDANDCEENDEDDNGTDTSENNNANTSESDDSDESKDDDDDDDDEKDSSDNDDTSKTEKFSTNMSKNDDKNRSKNESTNVLKHYDTHTSANAKKIFLNNSSQILKNHSLNISENNITDVSHTRRVLTEIEAYKPSLQEQIHDSISHVSSLIDGYHVAFTEELNKEEVILTEDEINVRFKDRMFDIVAHVLPDLKNLANLTDNPTDSAGKVNEHFGEDHIIIEIAAVVDPEVKPPFVDSLAKDISEFASSLVRLILGTYSKKKS